MNWWLFSTPSMLFDPEVLSTDSEASSFTSNSQSTTSAIPCNTDSQESVISISSSLSRNDYQDSINTPGTESQDSINTPETESQDSINTPGSESQDSITTTRSNSQESIINISAESSLQNLVSNAENVPTNIVENTDGSSSFTNYCPSIIRYCQGLTVSTSKKSKTTSTVADIQIFMTTGQDPRLVSESEDLSPVYVLCKATKIIALLVDKIDPGQYIVTYGVNKIKVGDESIHIDSESKNSVSNIMYVKNAVISKYTGSILHANLGDTKILMLGSFHKQPLTHKMISTNQILSTKVAMLENDISQQILDQNSPIKHNQTLLQMINKGIQQMSAIEKRKEMSEVTNSEEPKKKKPKFQLRVVLRQKSKKKIGKSQSNSSQSRQCSMDNFVTHDEIVDRE